MTKVEIDPGICKFLTRLEAAPSEDDVVAVSGESECPRVQKYLADLGALKVSSALGRCCLETVFAPAAQASLHPACPVPVGVLKAVEVAAGLALPRQVSIRFLE